jgi:hypothetical protein
MSVYCCLFRYRLSSPETFGYTLVNLESYTEKGTNNSYIQNDKRRHSKVNLQVAF